ncbi:unnamed protein product (macronuclear) [Paramecium tetraurelia]|uniref:Uncharacterized protein n=1 Tax=Paramecium tetraurelia TaxID=5888 RepID=A0D3P1_PARTE|nr:uncharacterized protein GSPATT00013146001 [Paramecium tetraurelia]CAK77658.1 unnamed protein product [Paramecium tetraurelia]|eukprot:XP_001445055.1 hypothetical protein (macronuclear) [Paramecium tetraurelia strain d4-2]
MDNIVSFNSNTSNSKQPNRKKPSIIEEKESNEPRSLIKFKQYDQSVAESEIVPIQIPEILLEKTPQNKKIFTKQQFHFPRVIQGQRLNICGIKQFKSNHVELAKNIITTYLEDRTMYCGQYLQRNIPGNGAISKERLLLDVGERKQGKKSGNGVEYYTNRTNDKIQEKQYWKIYNGTFEMIKFIERSIGINIRSMCIRRICKWTVARIIDI